MLSVYVVGIFYETKFKQVLISIDVEYLQNISLWNEKTQIVVKIMLIQSVISVNSVIFGTEPLKILMIKMDLLFFNGGHTDLNRRCQFVNIFGQPMFNASQWTIWFYC